MVFVNDPFILLFGGDQSSRAVINELWAYNKDNSQWEKKESNNPPRRHRHASVKNNDKMITFFGEGLSGLLSDIWQYDPATNTWEELPSGGASTPPARKNHSVTSIGEDSYICGGTGSDGLGLSDLWSYNHTTGIWTQKSEHPGSCAGLGSFHYDGSLYAFAGYEPEYSSYRNDIWCYSPATNTWDYVNAGGTLPGGRAFFATAQDPMGSFLVFGGQDTSRAIALSDNYKFDANTLTWTQLADGPARSKAAAVYCNDTSIYLFGGLDELGNATNNLWKYNPSTDTWEEILGVDNPEVIVPLGFSLSAYPNPFSSGVTIEYQVAGYNQWDLPANIKIYDLKGCLVRTLPITNYQLPITNIVWDGKDTDGGEVQSGIYFIKAKGYKPVKVVKLR
ncbi:MAG: hypothetical protein KAW92_06655 [Candidatus Cloacimonetes bacterium]|nr:hypothetical protein [Candidatus Cloacimonadota bacterium]